MNGAKTASEGRRGDLPLFLLSVGAGLGSYGFSLLVDRAYGSLVLGQVLRLVSAVSAVTLPSALVLLPAAAWAGHAVGLRRRLPGLQLGALVLGALSAGAFALLDLHAPAGWLPGLLLMALCYSYPFYLGSGVVCGRGAFIVYGVVNAVPTVGRLLILLGVLALHGTVAQAMWGLGVAAVAGAALATALSYQVSGATPRTPPASGATWASAFVALAVTAWLSSDIVFGSVGLAPQAASLFAVIALVGKAPYWLAQPLATKAIAQTGLGTGGGTAMAWEIFAIGGLALAGGLIVGRFVLHIMQVPSSGLLPLLAYFAGSTLLARAYVSAGSAAQLGRHQWWPLLATFAAFALLAMVWPTDVLGLALRFLAGIAVATAVQMLLERRDSRPLQRGAAPLAAAARP